MTSKRFTKITVTLATLLFAAVAGGGIAYAISYSKVNSDNGSHLCSPGWVNSDGKCTTVDTNGKMRRAVRAWALSIHPNWGLNTWSCSSTAFDSQCYLTSNPGERLIVKNCTNDGCTKRCEFFTRATNGTLSRQGRVAIDTCSAQSSDWVFDNGGVGYAFYPKNQFIYNGP